MNLEACLPEVLRGPQTTIERTASGLSGAGVYRVQSGERALVLKVAAEGAPAEAWRHTLHLQQEAAEAGLAPRVVHVDEDRRAVLTEFVVDRSYAALYLNPTTHAAALKKLAELLRRVHALPLRKEAEPRDPRAFLAAQWSLLCARGSPPPFVSEAVDRVLREEAPASDRPAVLSHNDPNPTNLVFDGERLLLLDWEAAGPNDAYFDLAVVSVFLRMDSSTCLELLSLHDGAPIAALPERFGFMRRLAAALPGVVFLRMARQHGHPGAEGETLDSALSLGDCFQRIRSGALKPSTAEGQWTFGLALVKESTTL
jgi:thiamine kinase-like enzyme